VDDNFPTMHDTLEPAGVSLLEQRHQCRITLFYEDFQSAMHASHELGGLMHRLESAGPVRASSWSFDLLHSKRLAPTVARDSADADVVVVAAHGGQRVPAHVGEWIANCLARESDARPTVIALHDEALEADGGAAPLCDSLKQIADRQCACFLCGADLKQYKTRFVRGQGDQASSRVAPARHGAARASAVANRWFGIND
jgi:hypothetical protein